jgi:hypothetical protein
MAVRAKFRCNYVIPYNDGFKVNLSPVTYGSEENKKFYQMTPWGECYFGTVNAEAAKCFEQGKEYYIDFIKAE